MFIGCRFDLVGEDQAYRTGQIPLSFKHRREPAPTAAAPAKTAGIARIPALSGTRDTLTLHPLSATGRKPGFEPFFGPKIGPVLGFISIQSSSSATFPATSSQLLSKWSF
jgi:hypothetical protein